jgi:hypothetical protein
MSFLAKLEGSKTAPFPLPLMPQKRTFDPIVEAMPKFRITQTLALCVIFLRSKPKLSFERQVGKL